jgi:hypothetical protein
MSDFPTLEDLNVAMQLVDAGKFLADPRAAPLVDHLLAVEQPGGRRDQALLRIGFMYAMKSFDVMRERLKSAALLGGAESATPFRDLVGLMPNAVRGTSADAEA